LCRGFFMVSHVVPSSPDGVSQETVQRTTGLAAGRAPKRRQPPTQGRFGRHGPTLGRCSHAGAAQFAARKLPKLNIERSILLARFACRRCHTMISMDLC
jgi:hypothetical protein